MKLLKLILCFIVFSLFSLTSYSQKETIWEDASEGAFELEGERQIIPEHYNTLKINVNALKSLIESAPMEFTSDAKNNPVILQLPMPDGSFERFSIVESPMVEKELSDKFPGLRTWSGQGIETPSATAKLDFTIKGFHAMVLSPDGDWFIDPYSTETIEYYISYFKRDLKGKSTFQCDVQEGTDKLINQLEIKKKGAGTGNIKSKNSQGQINSNARFGDCLFRTYRLALAATGEYTTFHGGTVALCLAAQVTAMNRVNGIYERDFALRMNLIGNNNLIIYTNAATDPYTNNNGSTMLGQNQSNLDAVIGTANYDIGHVFSTGGGGIAQLNSPCGSTSKARGVTGLGSPIGDPFYIDYVAHEMGHQWGGNHTFNNCSGSGNGSSGIEVGSGVTIQAYAGICGATNVQSNSDAMFHAYSIEDMYNFITAGGNACAVSVATSNNFPDILTNTPSQTIPQGTSFMLTCTAIDADGDSLLTYSWEQMDGGSVATAPPVSTSTSGPNFRTFLPSTSPTRYFPRLQDIVNNVSPTWEVIPTVGRTMNFRLMVRDNYAGAGCNDHADITLTVNGASGPFLVSSPNTGSEVWTGFTSETVTWAVANTDVSPVSCPNVDIFLSTDGGFTYSDTLALSVPNTGSYAVMVPNTPTSTARIMVIGNGRAFFDISNNNFSIVAGSIGLTCFGSSVNASCNGAGDGSASVQAIGGTAPYSYLWSNSGTTQTINSLSVGTYTINVMDALGADTTFNIIVSEPSAIIVSSVTTDATCGGYSDGTAILSVSGGVPITAFSTDTLFEEDFEDNLANGFTQVTNATDGGWLLGTASALSSTSWTIPSHGIIAATNDDACDCDKGEEYFILPPQNFGSFGSITLKTEIYFEGNTYLGNTELGSIVASTDNGATWNTLTTLTGSGSWSSVDTDLSAYAGMNNVWIAYKYEDGGGWLYGYAVDDIMIVAQSASPISYTYQWSNGLTDSSATNLSAGTYTITVSDANGCSTVHNLTINEPPSMNITLSKSNVNCFGGSDGTATIATSGGVSPYTYSWNTVPSQTTTFISNLSAAIYIATVTDANGCTKTGSVDVRVPNELVAFYVPNNPDSVGASNGDINLLVTGGIAPYTHLWSNGATTEDIFNLSAGAYFCTTTDRNGCAVLTMANLVNPPPFAPNGNLSKTIFRNNSDILIYPNPVSDFISIQFVGEEKGDYLLRIYNTSGSMVYEHSDIIKPDYYSDYIDMINFPNGIYIINIQSDKLFKSFRISKL